MAFNTHSVITLEPCKDVPKPRNADKVEDVEREIF